MDDLLPSPVANMDMRTYRMSIGLALSDPEDPNVSPAFIAWARGNVKATAAKKRQEDLHLFLLHLAIEEHLRRIEEQIAEYNKMASWYHDQATRSREKMGAAEKKLTAINDFIEGVDGVIGDKERTGKFDREKAIELLRSRGISVEENESDGSLETRLRLQKKAANAERPALSDEYEHYKTETEHNEEMERENIRKAKELSQKRDEIKSSGMDEATQEKQLDQLSDQASLDIKNRAAKIEEEKNIAPPLDIKKSENKSLETVTNKDEEDAFLATAGNLTKKFSAATAKISDPIPPTMTPTTATPPRPTA